MSLIGEFSMARWAMVTVMAATGLAGAAEPDAANPDAPLSAYYGFLAPEVYKLDYRTANLMSRDVDGDGKLDLVIVNNLQNRIDVLAQRGEKASPAKSPRKPNDIPNDQRMEHRKIPVRRSVTSLDMHDVNSDGKADLVYLGDPSGLYIEYQQPDGNFGQERVFENSDVVNSAWALDVGDVDGDGRPDIAYVGRQYLYLVLQEENGRLKNPKRFRLGPDGASLLRILDINADGRNDLAYFAQSSDLPFRVRFQEEDGTFGPERRMRIDPPRGVSFADLDGKPGQEVLAVSSLNQRLYVYGLDRSDASDDRPASQIEIFPFDLSGAGKSPDLAIADFTGDGRIDVAASDVDSSQISFFPKTKLSTTFPWILGTEALRPVDVDQDGQSALLSLSSKDKTIAVSHYEDGRLTFPQVIPTSGEPAAMEVVGKGQDARIVYLTKTTGEGGKSGYAMGRLKPRGGSDVDWEVDQVGEKELVELELPSRPTDLRAMDVNADGRTDLMAFLSYKPPVVLLGQEDGSYLAVADTSKGTLGNLTSADTWFGPLRDGKDAFLVAQDNFARNVQMQSGNRWQVLDQFNAASGSAKVKGVATLDLVGDAKPEIVLYDRVSQSLAFLREEDGVFRNWQTQKIGPFDVRGMRTADFNADGSMDLLLFDGEKMGVVYSRVGDLIVRPIASYETDNKDGQLFDMVPGDLNGNGELDLLLLDPMDHNLEIVTWTDKGELERVTRWQVFEEKTFNRDSGGTLEPREAIIADVDGDGLKDIALLVHDRVIIYRQDPGEGENTSEKASVSKP